MLDARLRMAANMVRSGSRLADIGTDHAHVPITLVQEGRCLSAIASDVRPGPADNARRNIRQAGLETVIAVRLGDGLHTIRADEVDDILIAGMGGETIAEILEAAPWVKSPSYRLILQPMTRAEKLRAYLFTHGFTLRCEQVTFAGKHWYTVLCAEYTGDILPAEEARCYVGRIPLPEGEGYLRALESRLRRQQQAHPTEAQAVCLQQIRRYRCGEWNPWEET